MTSGGAASGTDDAYPTVRRVADRLERDLGLRFDGPGLQRLERGLHDVAAAAGRPVEAHAELLQRDPAARQDLVDLVTVQETSWFRDPAAFAALADHVLPAAAERAQRDGGRRVRVWSAGCAHGQEPWSLAILAAELGIQIDVLASDVTRPALARAADGVYHERELRGLDEARRRRWLEPVDGGHRVRDAVRRSVRVIRHDLVLDPPPLPAADLVLCRYVLIYLAPDAARRVLDGVARVLEPEGRLLVGGAESLWHVTDRFVAEPFAGAFAYRPQATEPDGPTPAHDVGARHRDPHDVGARHRDPGARPSAVGTTPSARKPRRTVGPSRPPTAPPPERDDLLDAGNAAMAAGDLGGAVAAFRGAAYLDPDAVVAHLQLGLALEQLDDPGAHRAFKAAWAALARTNGAGLPEELDGWRTEELVRLVGVKLGAIR